ncbi:MAG: CDP-alcohol phosphatidyltransferase family protein, partial [Pseudomonadota bacterium]
MFGESKNAMWAFCVHILTASGAFLAFLSIVSAAEYDFAMAFFWLGLALIVDGVDGPLARKLEVKRWWPHWSGDMLDNVIDYTTYVMIPAFILY